jgi:hypothetical protein
VRSSDSTTERRRQQLEGRLHRVAGSRLGFARSLTQATLAAAGRRERDGRCGPRAAVSVAANRGSPRARRGAIVGCMTIPSLYYHPYSRAANVVPMLEEVGVPYELLGAE